MPKITNEELKDLIEKSLLKSALRAREIALQTNTPIVISVDGETKEVMVTEQDVANYRERIKHVL